MNVFREQSGATKAQMSRELNIDAGTFGNIMNGKRGMPVEMLISFLQVYPMVSAEWLLRGEGQCVRSTEQVVNICHDIVASSYNMTNDGKSINRLISLLEEKDMQINRLIKIIEDKIKETP